MKDNDGTSVISSSRSIVKKNRRRKGIFKEKIDYHSVCSMRDF